MPQVKRKCAKAPARDRSGVNTRGIRVRELDGVSKNRGVGQFVTNYNGPSHAADALFL
jgi:hypothetical protein